MKKKPTKREPACLPAGIVAVLDDNTHIALFFTGRNHAGENLDDLQTHRDPEKNISIQMCDTLSRNTTEVFTRYLSHCLSHGRRRFVDIIPAFPEECEEVINLLAEVYKNNAVTKDKKMSDEERLAYHQEHSEPVMDTLHNSMKKQIDEKLVEPNSVLGSAITYMLKYWPALTLFLRMAGAPLDNNICYADSSITNIMPLALLCRVDRVTRNILRFERLDDAA